MKKEIANILEQLFLKFPIDIVYYGYKAISNIYFIKVPKNIYNSVEFNEFDKWVANNSNNDEICFITEDSTIPLDEFVIVENPLDATYSIDELFKEMTITENTFLSVHKELAAAPRFDFNFNFSFKDLESPNDYALAA